MRGSSTSSFYSWCRHCCDVSSMKQSVRLCFIVCHGRCLRNSTVWRKYSQGRAWLSY
ncbi:rCG28795 [Rattus norvegicus]|uniref:RCG28795 n=1 Tax=Rattus norvegicus TaxID=10116 RepID=A6HVV8_RAT|nr:rCG28795 [Rattus norvegicus]